MELPKRNKTELIWLPQLSKLNYLIKQHQHTVLWQPITINMLSHQNTATLVTKQTIIWSLAQSKSYHNEECAAIWWCLVNPVAMANRLWLSHSPTHSLTQFQVYSLVKCVFGFFTHISNPSPYTVRAPINCRSFLLMILITMVSLICTMGAPTSEMDFILFVGSTEASKVNTDHIWITRETRPAH